MKVTYPIKDITNENVETKLGSNNKYGKYPVGIYNAWHGGIHLEDKEKEIQAIADGRVIAYRLAAEEKEESIDSEIDNEQKYNYSNSFILIQHDYKSPEGLEMTFYSVYHHLLSKTGIEEAGLELPKTLTQTELKVLEKAEKVKGINARSATKYSTKEFVIPKGTTVTFDNTETESTHWSNGKNLKKYKYKKVTYTDLLGTTHTNIYIATADNRINDAGEILTAEDTGKPAEKGAQLKDAPKKTATITSIIKKDTVVTNLEKKGNYTKIKYTQENGIEQEGYIWTKSLEEKENFDESILDQIQASDLKIKAGQPIGYVGKYGVEKSPNYTASHLEIFTTKNINDFLENTKNDGKDKKHFATVPKDTKLKTNLEIAVNIKEKTPLKVLKFEGDYTQIKTQDIIGTVQHEHLTGWNATTKTYKIKEAHFATVNTIFNNQLSKSDLLHYKSQKGQDRTVFLKIDGSNKKYWIPKTDLAQVEIGECNEEEEEVITYENAVVGDTTKTNKAITKAYIEPPTENCDEETGETVQEETVNKEHITNLRKFKKVKDNKKEIWYKAELTYKIDEQEETKKGWLAQKDIELFSAYDWHKFGFQKLEAGSEFVYSLKDIKEEHVNATVPKDQIAPFIKKVWDIIDADGDKKLTPIELELAFEDPEKVETLSKLVCTHKSEWSYQTEKIKTEAEEIYNLAMGTNPSEKLKKQKESRILALENRMKELMFWEEAKDLAYTGEVDTKLPPREFPSTDMVHYFHPIAFVRQFKLMEKKYDPWPVGKKYKGHKRRLGSGYGKRNVEGRPEASKFHRGLDINFGGGFDDYGAPVIATHDGIIVEAKDTTTGSGGRTITIQSENEIFQTRYNHLSIITVSKNDLVYKGDKIGEIGASAWGKEKGSDSHLHYAIKKLNSNGKMDWYNPTEGKENKGENIVDPQDWI